MDQEAEALAEAPAAEASAADRAEEALEADITDRTASVREARDTLALDLARFSGDGITVPITAAEAVALAVFWE